VSLALPFCLLAIDLATLGRQGNKATLALLTQRKRKQRSKLFSVKKENGKRVACLLAIGVSRALLRKQRSKPQTKEGKARK